MADVQRDYKKICVLIVGISIISWHVACMLLAFIVNSK